MSPVRSALRRARPMLALLLAGLIVAAARPAQAYLHFTLSLDNGDQARLRWDVPRVRWLVSDRGVPGVPPAELRGAIERAMATWEAVPTAAISFDFGGSTSADPFEDDTLSVFGFLDEPDLERVLGATSFTIDVTTGEIVESDVFFNAAFAWSTAAGGDFARFDLESVALHEIGHFLGLGHSAIGETELRAGDARDVIASGAVMFPIAFGPGSIADRELQPDDIAGISDLYPAAGFRERTGAIRGRVLHDGMPALGAHVTAFNLQTGAIVGGFAIGEGGEFQIAGLTPGAYIIRVEPLDDADVESFFTSRGVDLDFQVTFYPQLLAAPVGGVGERVEIEVRPK